MEPIALTSSRFWADSRPRVFAPPRLEDEADRLQEGLADRDWAREAVVFASSGSSGPPKWVLLRKTALLASAAMVNRHLEVSSADHWLLTLPGWHVGGFGVAARAVEAACGYSVLEGGWDPKHFVEICRNDGATCTSLVPTQVHDLVAAGLSAPDHLRAVVVGGGELAAETGRAARGLGWPVLQSYGMTEAGSQIATASLDSLLVEFSPRGLPVLSGWQVALGEHGRLQIRGEALFEGYVREEGDRLQLFAGFEEGWFVSNDLVSLHDEQLSFIGRVDRTVKILGELVEVDVLERALAELGRPVGEVRLVEMADPRAGVRLVPAVTGSVEEWEAIVARFNRDQPGYARLALPVGLAEFPLTALGKPDLEVLRRLITENSPSVLPSGGNST